ncbi:MAG: hypothetical protein OXQ26_02885 [bacterium]|nr:hypothetical protein [bacterium]
MAVVLVAVALVWIVNVAFLIAVVLMRIALVVIMLMLIGMVLVVIALVRVVNVAFLIAVVLMRIALVRVVPTHPGSFRADGSPPGPTVTIRTESD